MFSPNRGNTTYRSNRIIVRWKIKFKVFLFLLFKEKSYTPCFVISMVMLDNFLSWPTGINSLASLTFSKHNTAFETSYWTRSYQSFEHDVIPTLSNSCRPYDSVMNPCSTQQIFTITFCSLEICVQCDLFLRFDEPVLRVKDIFNHNRSGAKCCHLAARPRIRIGDFQIMRKRQAIQKRTWRWV